MNSKSTADRLMPAVNIEPVCSEGLPGAQDLPGHRSIRRKTPPGPGGVPAAHSRLPVTQPFVSGGRSVAEPRLPATDRVLADPAPRRDLTP